MFKSGDDGVCNSCTIFGLSSHSVIQLCVFSPFIVCVLMPSGFRQRAANSRSVVSGFQTATCVCSSAEMEPLRSAASGLETGERLHSDCLTVCFSITSSSHCFYTRRRCLCVALASSFCRFHLTFFRLDFVLNSEIIPAHGRPSSTDWNVSTPHSFQKKCWKLASNTLCLLIL